MPCMAKTEPKGGQHTLCSRWAALQKGVWTPAECPSGLCAACSNAGLLVVTCALHPTLTLVSCEFALKHQKK